MRVLRPFASRVVPLVSARVRAQTRLNALRIFGRVLTPSRQGAFTRGVVSHFYDFVVDVGRAGHETAQSLRARIERVEGEQRYKDLRERGRGALLVTAHMGSFEVGLAALAGVERRVHVVYKRDPSRDFEAMRARVRRMLGVIEVPIEDGLQAWMHLREALSRGEVVVMQADRAMPGQRSVAVPFLHGTLRVPTGPARLALLTGCPIVPVFTVRRTSGRFAVHLCPAIEPGHTVAASGDVGAIVAAMAGAIEAMVARYPTQWLALGAAFEEDATHA